MTTTDKEIMEACKASYEAYKACEDADNEEPQEKAQPTVQSTDDRPAPSLPPADTIMHFLGMILQQVNDMRRELTSLREHLGLIAHE